MKNPIACAVLLVAAGYAAGCAPAPAPTTGLARECFRVDQVNGFSDARGASIRVTPSVGKTFALDLIGPGCEDVGWADQIALEGSPSPSICTGGSVSQGRVLFRDTASSQLVRCEIAAVTRIANRPSS